MLPQEFLERMENMLGEEYPAFLKSYDIARYQALRLNPQKGDDASFLNRMVFSLERVQWAEHGFYYTAKDTPGYHPYHEAGVYYIQEPSAMAPAAYLTRQMADGAGERILDLCAAPGGKSLHAAGLFNLNERSVEYGYRLYDKLYPASTTKLMTAYLALKYGKLEDMVTVTDSVTQTVENNLFIAILFA